LDVGTSDTTLLDDLGPLYHSYELFGVRNAQLPGLFAPNQRAKAAILQAYIQYAIAKSRSQPHDRVRFAELFCADGYYAMVARLFGADESVGIDNNKDPYFTLAPSIASRLGLDHVAFVEADVHDLRGFDPFTIVANVGGLYHVSDPIEVLRTSWDLTERFLIVQSVVSLARTGADYVETPAPGWTWGSRFNQAWLHAQLVSLGGRIVDTHANELAGNDRPEDRGSFYAIVERT
jgi:hypothetical protein